MLWVYINNYNYLHLQLAINNVEQLHKEKSDLIDSIEKLRTELDNFKLQVCCHFEFGQPFHPLILDCFNGF